MVTKYLLCAAIAASSSEIEDLQLQSDSSVYSDYYPDLGDTTSFDDAYEFTYDELEYSENFGVNDQYDYVKYTATYSRNVFLMLYATNDKIANVEVFMEDVGFSKYVTKYDSNATGLGIYDSVFVEKGETIYFRISCTGVCNWVGTIVLNPDSGNIAVKGFKRMYSYEMPFRNGEANICYDFDESFKQKVPGQDFTYAECVREAMDVWESLGGVRFKEDKLRKSFTCTVRNDLSTVNLEYYQYNITLNTVCRTFEVPGNLSFYEGINGDSYNWDGSPLTIKQAVLGTMIYCCGFALGLLPRTNMNDMYNMMYHEISPYCGALGDGDTASYLYLWTDMNYYNSKNK